MFLEMQIFAFRVSLRLSREMTFQICCSCAPRHIVACYSTSRFVGRSVGHILLFLGIIFFDPTAPAQMPGNLKYGPCPPARDWGSCVSSLVSR